MSSGTEHRPWFATDIGVAIRSFIDRRFANLVSRRRVVGVEAEGYYRTVSLDPLVTGELTYPALRGIPVSIDDDVLVLRVGGGYVIVGALPDPQNPQGA